MRGCMMPMSSPMMKRMLGFCCCWADAGGMAAVKEAAHASAPSHLLCLILIGTVLRCGCYTTESRTGKLCEVVIRPRTFNSIGSVRAPISWRYASDFPVSGFEAHTLLLV